MLNLALTGVAGLEWSNLDHEINEQPLMLATPSVMFSSPQEHSNIIINH